MTSFQDLNFRGKQISLTFSYFLINKALLYHSLMNFFAHNKKITEKYVFSETLSPEMTSQSFPVSCFLVSQFCTPQEVKFHVFITSQGRKIAIKYFLAMLISINYCGDFI